jgi:hypothetical protein
MPSKKELENQNRNLQQALEQCKSEKDTQIQSLNNENEALKERLKELENQRQREKLQLEEMEKRVSAKKEEPDYLKDTGYQTLLGFKLIPPLLDKVIGRPFIITVAEEFNYKEAPDRKGLTQWMEDSRKVDGGTFHTFRDEIKENHSFRVTYSYSSREYTLETAQGKLTYHELMFPGNLQSGLEVNSNNKSAIYLALKSRKMQSAVLPKEIFGAPLLSYAFPIHDEKGTLIGAVSFSNDITQIVNMAKSLGDIVSSKSDTTLHKLANTLKEELFFSEHASGQVQEEALFTKKTAEYIRKKGKEVIDIAEKLKVLALNTAIEATKVGKSGKGVGIISEQMKSISDTTRKTLKEVFDKSRELSLSSEKVLETSGKLRSSASDLKEESSILFKTSLKITDQKDELAGLVRMSIDEIAQDQEDLNNIFLLIKKDQEKD